MENSDNFPLISARENAEIGVACIAMTLAHYGHKHLLNVVRDLAHLNCNPEINWERINEIFQALGFVSDTYETTYEWLLKTNLPCIAVYKEPVLSILDAGNYFIVVYKATADTVWIADPLKRKKYTLSKEEFEEKWAGIVATAIPTENVLQDQDIKEKVEIFRAMENKVPRPITSIRAAIAQEQGENRPVYDLLIVGAGPAGLFCAVEAKKKGLDYLIVEKGALVNSICQYPKNMSFITPVYLLEVDDVPFKPKLSDFTILGKHFGPFWVVWQALDGNLADRRFCDAEIGPERVRSCPRRAELSVLQRILDAAGRSKA